MIDLNEPVRRTYSDDEGREVNKSFLLLLYYFLILYQLLHNLFIPLALNIFRGSPLLTDIHYWFLFTLPVVYWIRRGLPLPGYYLLFIFLGSLSRIVIYSSIYFSKSWTIVSVYLSEISILVFCFILYQKARKDNLFFLGYLGLIIPFFLTTIESHSTSREITFPVSSRSVDYTKEGCEGSMIRMAFPHTDTHSSSVSIATCGFTKNKSTFDKSFRIINTLDHMIHFRLFRLSHREGKLYWKFVRLLKLEAHTFISIDSLLKNDTIFLLKAPERRNLGIHLLIPTSTTLQGALSITPDTIVKEVL